MQILRSPEELAPFARAALIPTMGGLHEGHLALASLAKDTGLPVVVTIFVNPKQFEEAIDFKRYPRDVEADAAMLEPLGVDAVFAPEVDDVYPPDAPPSPVVIPPVAGEPGLEDRYRPGHLPGVCAVLWRLFVLTRPAAAIFGEKDWQQMLLARAVAQQYADRSGEPLRIIPAPTVREPDGLAMSSRNRFLPEGDRAKAATISQALVLATGEPDAAAAEDAMRAVMEDAGLTVEYAVIRDAQTLREPVAGDAARALIAARVGEVRLIDNDAWPPAMLRV